MYNHFMKEMGFGDFFFSFHLQAQVQYILSSTWKSKLSNAESDLCLYYIENINNQFIGFRLLIDHK